FQQFEDDHSAFGTDFIHLHNVDVRRLTTQVPQCRWPEIDVRRGRPGPRDQQADGSQTGEQKGSVLHLGISCYGCTVNDRSMRIAFRCLSFTATVNLPRSCFLMRWASVSSQRESGRALNFLARFSPAGTSPMGKSASTWKLSISRPV